MRDDQVARGRIGIRRSSDEHVKQQAAERIDVRSMIDVARSAALLGGHVRRRSERRADERQRRVARTELADPEIEDLRALAALRLGIVDEEYVLRLEVAMA